MTITTIKKAPGAGSTRSHSTSHHGTDHTPGQSFYGLMADQATHGMQCAAGTQVSTRAAVGLCMHECWHMCMVHGLRHHHPRQGPQSITWLHGPLVGMSCLCPGHAYGSSCSKYVSVGAAPWALFSLVITVALGAENAAPTDGAYQQHMRLYTTTSLYNEATQL